MQQLYSDVSEFKRWLSDVIKMFGMVLGVFFVVGSLHAQQTFDEPVPNLDAKALASAEVLGLYFTPPADAAAAVVAVIDQSQSEVLVQAYGFTHNGIAQALIRAHQRGVTVKVLLDQKSETSNRYVIEQMANHDLTWRLDGKHAIAHNKVIVVDSSIVITGSFNFTNSAQTRNAENLLVLKSLELADSYKQNWSQHWAHSR